MKRHPYLILNDWVAKYIMGYENWYVGCLENDKNKIYYYPKSGTRHRWIHESGVPEASRFSPSTDSDAAMEVLNRCNKFINKRKSRDVIGISTLGGNPMITYMPDNIIVHANTMELAICLFAKKLFSRK